MGQWAGKYDIPDEEYDTVFLPLLCKYVFELRKACSLLEKHNKYSPILIDLDFRYPSGGPLLRRFTTEQIRQFVAAYADAFARFFEPPPDPLKFYVMLKPAPEADSAHDQHKDGVHIVCPTLTTTPEIQYAIRGYLIQSGAMERIFGSTGTFNPHKSVWISLSFNATIGFYMEPANPIKRGTRWNMSMVSLSQQT